MIAAPFADPIILPVTQPGSGAMCAGRRSKKWILAERLRLRGLQAGKALRCRIGIARRETEERSGGALTPCKKLSPLVATRTLVRHALCAHDSASLGKRKMPA
jgi:hypothetical protein